MAGMTDIMSVIKLVSKLSVPHFHPSLLTLYELAFQAAQVSDQSVYFSATTEEIMVRNKCFMRWESTDWLSSDCTITMTDVCGAAATTAAHFHMRRLCVTEHMWWCGIHRPAASSWKLTPFPRLIQAQDWETDDPGTLVWPQGSCLYCYCFMIDRCHRRPIRQQWDMLGMSSREAG